LADRRGPDIRATGLILGVVLLAYVNALIGPFQFDDYNVIVDNAAVTRWPPDLGGLRPVLKLSYAANWQTGAGAFGFHLFNVAVHALNALMVFALGLRLACRFLDPAPARRAAMIGALLFALHPVHTEAVTYISGRSASLMTCFYLGSVLAYLRGRDLGSPLWLNAFSPLLFVAALLTKETAITLPFALLLWHLCCERGRPNWPLILRAQRMHWALLFAGLVAMSLRPDYRELLEFAPSAETLRTQVHGTSYLLSRWFALGWLNIDPDLRAQTTWTATLLAQLVGLVLLLAAGLWALRTRPWWSFGVLWLCLQLVPGNTLIVRWDVANERQLYLAGVGIFIASGIALARMRPAAPRSVASAAIVALLLLFASFTVLRNFDYRSAVALWEDAARKSPHKARVHNNLGDAYLQAGYNDRARASFLKALDIDPDYLLARNNLRALDADMSARARPPG
jgi:protein O-mannosyl-transferase